MESLQNIWQLFLHFDKYLDVVIPQFGLWTYWFAAFIIFAEVGLVVTGFLPGDSLLFTLGAIAARGTLSISLLLPLLCIAAVFGNITNYQIGFFLSPILEKRKKIPLFSHEHILQAHSFFAAYGRIAVSLARFLPVIRTFVPLAAGISKMEPAPFITYSLLGCCAWVCGYVLAGYFFGNIPFIKNNFMLVILGIVAITLLPVFVKILVRWLRK